MCPDLGCGIQSIIIILDNISVLGSVSESVLNPFVGHAWPIPGQYQVTWSVSSNQNLVFSLVLPRKIRFLVFCPMSDLLASIILITLWKWQLWRIEGIHEALWCIPQVGAALTVVLDSWLVLTGAFGSYITYIEKPNINFQILYLSPP